VSHPPSELARILEATQIAVEQIDRTPFSVGGFNRLKQKIDEYIVQLVTESVRVSKAREADSISSSYVDHASRYLISGRGSKLSKLVGIFGGVLFGVGTTTVVRMILDNSYSTRGIIIAFACTVVGALTISLQATRD
jgi:hypothetical protein